MAQEIPVKTRTLESLYGEVAIGAFGMTAGAAAPSTQALTGGATKVRTVNPDTEDSLDFDLVLPKSVETDVATVTVTPSVRWTAVDTPTANTLLYWKMDYTYAMPALVADGAADAISKFCDVRTLVSGVNTLTGKEYRRCLTTVFTGLSFPARNFLPGMVLVGNIRISSASTCGNSLIGVLGVGCGYLEGACGTSSIAP
jgi:hypothetical protein